MVLKRQVITALQRDRVDMLGTRCPAIKIADESIVAGLLLTVESNHFCLLKSRGAVLNIYEMGQYAPTTSDKPIIGSIAQGFFGGASPWHGKDAATIVAALAETEAGLKAIEATRRDRQALLLAIE